MIGLSRSIWSLAWRESRTARRRLLLYMSSISLGVAALVAIDSFSSNIIQSVKEQSRALMGGDFSLNSSKPLTPAIDSLLDSQHADWLGSKCPCSTSPKMKLAGS